MFIVQLKGGGSLDWALGGSVLLTRAPGEPTVGVAGAGCTAG